MQGQVRVPNDYFAKAKREYRDWEFAWIREAVQNAHDAGATTIRIQFQEKGDELWASVEDDGCGMDEPTLINGFLTLGGSHKSEGASGGFGYAKVILAFAHRRYEIRSNGLVVIGSGGDFRLSSGSPTRNGTMLLAVMEAEPGLRGAMEDKARLLAQFFCTDAIVTLNGEELRTDDWEADYESVEELGYLQFSESEDGYSELWIRVNGLPMFRWNHYGERKGFRGAIDLEGDSLAMLTSNRDGLVSAVNAKLQAVIRKLADQRETLRLTNAMDLTLNRREAPVAISGEGAPATNALTGSIPKPDRETEKEVFAREAQEALNRREKAWQKLSRLQADRYPENFHLKVDEIVLRRTTDSLPSVGEIIRRLNLKRVIKLGHAWQTAVQAVLATNYAREVMGVAFQEESGDRERGQYFRGRRRIQIGFVVAHNILGLHEQTAETINILLNPFEIGDQWLTGDLLDIALHEVAHMTAGFHDEHFIAVMDRLRKSLRRHASEQGVWREIKTAWRRAES